MFIVLVGPKGSGKSHIGRALERLFGVHFFPEPLWLAFRRDCIQAGRELDIPVGIQRVVPRITEALERHSDVCVETTGASLDILDGLLGLHPSSDTRIVRVSAPIELCLQRIASRDSTHQIPMDTEGVGRIHALSLALRVDPDLEVENTGLTDAQIRAQFGSLGLRAPSA